jgi:hypothetical protein
LTRSRLATLVGHDGGVDVQLLVVGDCPNEGPAVMLLRRALDDVGLSAVGFSTRVIGTQQEAEQAGFHGSPTILIDGRDPFAEPGRAPALACRVYRGEAGLSGVPALEPLRQALKQAADADRQ